MDLVRMQEEIDAEEERQSRLTPEERMRENGQELQRRLECEPAIAILLQRSPPGHMVRAECRAVSCPIAAMSPSDKGRRIMDVYRAVLVSDEDQYFHISCLEKMITLSSLAPSRFKLDMNGYRWRDGWPWTWGLMLRKWFEHSGCIDLAKIAEYIDAYDTFKEADSDFMTQWGEWEHTHRRECAADLGSCGCPPEPKGPVSPMLEGYKTEKAKICSIGEVLRHPYLERLSAQIHTSLHESILVFPEQEPCGGEAQKDGSNLEPRPKDEDNPSPMNEASKTKEGGACSHHV
ncbi:hypothetical protein V499_04727 [Pseudogymnoascus sp. VKM F-103]|nr:hypothetical protein V499_04727 [Pseudogymnoascus sp. VKM F-103]